MRALHHHQRAGIGKAMTRDEAKAIKAFKNYCNCGGFAWSMNGRSEARPHMSWCPQAEEYNEWYDAMHGIDAAVRYFTIASGPATGRKFLVRNDFEDTTEKAMWLAERISIEAATVGLRVKEITREEYEEEGEK